jgi:hypothetical protein
MVDINLFKEDGEEELGWGGESSGNEESNDDTIGDEFGLDEGEELDGELKEELSFEEDFDEAPTLDDEELLGDDDVVPDFDESEEDISDEDYAFGEVKRKSTSPVIWILLGIVVVGAGIYKFWWEPQQNAKKPVIATRPPDVNTLIEKMRQEQAQETPGETEGSEIESTPIVAETSKPPIKVSKYKSGDITGHLDAAVSVFENLSQQGQLGTIVIDGNQFRIGYVSATPNVANAMGHRIQTLLGVTETKNSPEERHQTAGVVRYWGVVSGSMPQLNGQTSQSQSKSFMNTDQFLNWLKEYCANRSIAVKQTETFTEKSVAGKKMIPVRIKTEGRKAQVIQFLKGLKGFQGNYVMTKVIFTSVNISDYEAKQVKVVLDFLYEVG